MQENGTAGARVRRAFGASTAVQTITLAPGSPRVDCTAEIDRHESETFLKAAFPLDVRADHAAAVTQFGHVGIGGAVREGHRINLPERRVRGSGRVAPLAATEHDGLVVSAVKLADDGSGDVVVRLYEALGARAAGRLTLGFAAAPVVVTDLLERPFDTPPPELTDGVVALVLRPFRILTLRLRRS